MDITQFLNKVNAAILNPLIALLFAVATVVFFWGIVKSLNSEGKDKEEAKNAVLWGLVGMFVMVSVFGIIKLILGTTGVGPNTGTDYIKL